MAQLLPEGLVIRRYPEIREAIVAAIQLRSETDLLFDEDTILGQIISILSQDQTIVEQVLQNIYSSLDRDKSEGTALDSLLSLVGLTRIGEGFSATERVLFTAPNDVTISKGFILENPSTRDRFLTTFTKLVSVASCASAVYGVTSNPATTAITATVDGVDYTYTTNGSPTTFDTVTGLAAAINADTVATVTASVVNTQMDNQDPPVLDPAFGDLLISSDTDTEITITALDYIEPVEVSVLIGAQAEEGGAIRAPANTITVAITPANVISVTNLDDVGVGRTRETDEEFRIRAERSLAVSGSATYAAVLAAVLNLPDIGTVRIEENETAATNALGLPPHSFEVIISAPVSDEIDQLVAKTLWDEKPIGIQTHGNTSVDYVDTIGVTRTINFSRPANIITATRVTYTLYDEEIPTTGIELAIRDAILAYGNSLTSGTDIIPKRFYQDIYGSTTGIEDITVEMQTITNTGDTPVGGSWSEARIPVAPSETSAFVAGDIYFVGP